MVLSLRRKGKSKQLIQQTLRAKGLDTDLICATLQAFDQDFVLPERDGDMSADYKAALIHARKKRLGPYSTKPLTEDIYKRSLGSLARAGFSYDIAKQVMDLDPDAIDINVMSSF